MVRMRVESVLLCVGGGADNSGRASCSAHRPASLSVQRVSAVACVCVMCVCDVERTASAAAVSAVSCICTPPQATAQTTLSAAKESRTNSAQKKFYSVALQTDSEEVSARKRADESECDCGAECRAHWW